MGAHSRNKGSTAEREVADKLFSELGIRFQRNLEQCREEAHGDLIADNAAFPFLIEVKRRAVANTCEAAWEGQAFRAAEKSGLFPAVVYRGDRRDWRCRIYADAVAEAFGTAAVSSRWFETDLQGFAWVAREIMAWRSEREGVMPKLMDVSGQRFGRLVALGRTDDGRVTCKCDCGNRKEVSLGMLRAGRTSSCGCLRADLMREKKTAHGMTGSAEYTAYQNAKNRCRREADPRFQQYGGRGIEFRFSTFAEFFEHIGPRPDGHSLDRIDPDGHYECGNVRWASLKEQARNKSTNRVVEYQGERMPLKAACEASGTPYKRAYERIVYLGWPVSKALESSYAHD